ncbi:MAG: DUF2189 domain-containing protein [Hyphomonas sp.]|nr:DUF2189 domain-containing protein [Hyphomonas sp.]
MAFIVRKKQKCREDNLDETSLQAAPARLPPINTIPLSAPIDWLVAGWRDFCAVPGPAFLYGLVLAAISAGIFWALYTTGSASWFYVLLGGFLLVGPVLGMGLYAASRALAAGQRPGLLDMIWVKDAARRDSLLLGLLLVFLYLLWTRIAQVVYALSTWRIHKSRSEFLQFVLFEPNGQMMVLMGLVTGGFVAFCNYSLASVAAPMLLDRRYDVFMAMATSVRAVNRNFYPMLLWAFLIVCLTLIGICFAFVGLAVVFPVVGMASWHAYRALVQS